MNNKNSFQKLLSEEQGCLNLEQLEGLLEANREQEPRTVRHVEDCPRCRSELALLRDFQTSELSGEEEQAVDWIIGHLDTSGWSKSPDCSEDQGQQTVMSDRRRSWIPVVFG